MRLLLAALLLAAPLPAQTITARAEGLTGVAVVRVTPAPVTSSLFAVPRDTSPHFDLAMTELNVLDDIAQGRDVPSLPGEPYSFEVAIDLLTRNPDFGLAAMVTHTIPLSEWRTGFQTVLDRKCSGAIKVVYDCQA